MLKVIELLSRGFESASVKTPEFKRFATIFKREFKKELEKVGVTDIKFSIGHFYISGFFTTKTGVMYYFTLPDVRGRVESLLYRTAKDYKDYTGGMNQYVKIMPNMVYKMNLK